MEKQFIIRPYGKRELAMAYTRGTMSAHASLNWLNNEIALFPGLLEQLQALGYRSGQRIITIAQLRAIVGAIGEP